MYEKALFLPAGDQTVVAELGDSIEPECNRRVHDLMSAIESSEVRGVVDLVPTYRSLLVQYDPLVISHADLVARVSEVETGLDEVQVTDPRVVEIPTLYSGEYAPDLEFVADNAGLTPEEVVTIHSDADYLVYMIGFTPGFPYLGGLAERLRTPRLDTPRSKIAAGSVGIADSQTGVYPVESPGGWRLIGRTPLKLFDPIRETPSTIMAGDHVRFVPLADESEYLDLAQQVDRGEYPLSTAAST